MSINYWVSGFCACGALVNISNGQYVWAVTGLACSLVNYFIARTNGESVAQA